MLLLTPSDRSRCPQARERSLVGIIRRDALLKLERVLGSPLERRLRPTAVLGMLQEMKKSNALLRCVFVCCL